jgi:hypothetical protein
MGDERVSIPLIPDARSDPFWPPCRSEATLVFDILLIRQFPSSFCFFRIDPPFS